MENKVKLHRTRHNKTKSDVNNNVISVFVNFKRYFILIYQFNSNKKQKLQNLLYYSIKITQKAIPYQTR